jgi:molybdopterin/thiamine biosynthesis adenylyltransferase
MARTDQPDPYGDMVSRNLGLLTEVQQQRLRSAKASVLGVGGIGGVAFEVLLRCGVGRFAIVDRDTFEPSNLNRQILATQQTLGRKKTEVALERAHAIHPDAVVDAWEAVNEETVGPILEDADVAVMAIDDLRPCLLASRKAREVHVPLVEGWAIPFGNVRVFTDATPTLEEAYGLPTAGRPVADVDDDELAELQAKVLLGLTRIEGVADFYDAETRRRAVEGHISSFAPMVWFTAVLMALEAVKVILGWGDLALAPGYGLYDPFRHRIPRVLPQAE